MDVFEASLSGIALLRVVGDIDHSNSPAFDMAAREALALNGGHLFVDLCACPYLDSGGASVLLSLLETMEVDGWIAVIGANADLLRVFELVGILKQPHFLVFADANEASAFLAVTPS